jgi:hypothetical protein
MPKLPQITITVEGGMIQDIDWPESLKGLFEVITMDFDDPDPDDENYRENHAGDGYIEGRWQDPA